MIDLYCERLGPGLWAEPLNVLTSLAFPLAAWLAWLHARRSGDTSGSTLTLILLIGVIGIGSTLFHTFAATWARVLDVLPILAFQLFFVWLYFRKVFATGRAESALAVAVLLSAALGGRLFPNLLNGSLTYLPAFSLLAAIGIHQYLRGKQERLTMALAALLFGLSLAFRSIDSQMCPFLPLGTHFLWHVLNATVLYLCVRAVVSSSTRLMPQQPRLAA
ncbi:MAG: ceramidase domain-containing protein [Chloroflexi bacterium]|nr:ceramidase domain-containing protein [Chloroflexota bacterium]